MSLNQPPRTGIKPKPEHKIRTGYTQEELDDFKDWLMKHGYGKKGQSAFIRHAIGMAMEKKNTDINEAEL